MDTPRNEFVFVTLLVASLAVGACARKATEPSASQPGPAQSAPQRVDPEDPKAGLNTNRPDSMKDVKPGTP